MVGVVFFILLTIWKWISEKEVHFLGNFGIAIFFALVNLFIDWGVKSHEYKKREINR